MQFQIRQNNGEYIVEAYVIEDFDSLRGYWKPLRNFGTKQGDAKIFKDSDCPKLSDAHIKSLINNYTPDRIYTRFSATRFTYRERGELARRVHVHSWPLDRDFTFEEWIEFLKTTDTSVSVAEFNGWKFNVHGVCLNPKEVATFRDGSNYYEIAVFQAPRPEDRSKLRWGCNLKFFFVDWGVITSVMNEATDELGATIAGLNYILRDCLREAEKWHDERGKAWEHWASVIRKEIDKRSQLSLF